MYTSRNHNCCPGISLPPLPVESRPSQQSSSVSSSSSPPSEWRLTDTATSSQLGRGDRLTDKKAQLDLREALLKDHPAINFCK